MAEKLKIGKMYYANIFPVFYALERHFECSSFEFVEGVPSELNVMLRNGLIDLSPSSSIEYLRNPSLYRIIEGHSISSTGPVGSIFLFSKQPIEELDRASIYVTSQSETSVGLLHVILRKFYGKHCSLRIAPFPQEQHDHPFLLIGDDAMRHNWQLKISEKQRASHFTYVYDLGEIWHNKTGLPFVFALWMVRREVFDDNVQRELLRHFTRYLDQSKEIIPNNLAEIAGHVPLSFSLPQNEIVAYWDNLDYELTDAHKRGLSLFEQYLRELDCL